MVDTPPTKPTTCSSVAAATVTGVFGTIITLLITHTTAPDWLIPLLCGALGTVLGYTTTAAGTARTHAALTTTITGLLTTLGVHHTPVATAPADRPAPDTTMEV